MPEALLVYTTFPNMDIAKQIIKTLLEQKLIVCANLREHISIYKHKSEVKEEKEIGVILKTKVSLKENLERKLKELHPYEVPVIFSIQADLNKEAFLWFCILVEKMEEILILFNESKKFNDLNNLYLNNLFKFNKSNKSKDSNESSTLFKFNFDWFKKNR